MTAEDFCDFFEVGIRMLFYEMRCSKSCYLYDLELVALFDVVEQGGFFGDDFLVDRTANFHFNVSGCSVSFSPANECTDIYFEYRRSLCQRVALFCIFDCSQAKISVIRHMKRIETLNRF